MAVDPEGWAALDSVPTSAEIGSVVGARYRLTRLLGKGGMGEVYEAEHIHITKKVAIKLLSVGISQNEEAVARFRQEAQSASSIGHDNIVRIDDFFVLEDGRVCMCMEFLQGQSLQDVIHQLGQSEAPRGIDIMCQVCAGLQAAHDKGIIHRDMKPENVFVARSSDGSDRAKILDFGIAKVTGNEDHNLTKTGTVFGTPHYMSPEQALGQKVDPRADIYSMGVMLFEMFTGAVPFQADSVMGVLSQHITQPTPLPSSIAPSRHVPQRMEQIIVKAMSKEADQRYRSARELREVLMSYGETLLSPGDVTRLGAASPMGQAAAGGAQKSLQASAAVRSRVSEGQQRSAPAAPASVVVPATIPNTVVAAAAINATAATAVAAPVAASRNGGRTGLWVGLSLAAVLLVGGAGVTVAFWGELTGRARSQGVQPASSGAQAGNVVGSNQSTAVRPRSDLGATPSGNVAGEHAGGPVADMRWRSTTRPTSRRAAVTAEKEDSADERSDSGSTTLEPHAKSRAVAPPQPHPPVVKDAYEVTVVTIPADAAVYRGGHKLHQRTPLTFKLRPGAKVRFKFAKAGRRDKTVTVVGEQRDQTIRIRLPRRTFGGSAMDEQDGL